MKSPITVALPLIALLVACSPGPSRDTEMEETLSGLVDAEQLVAMYSHDQIVVNISGQEPFQMRRNDREDLAERLAYAALNIHPDAAMVMIGFNRAEPDLQQVAYTWENHDGTLSPIASQ